MRFIKTFLMTCFVVVALCFLGVALHVQANGKSILEKQLSEVLHADVTIASCWYHFPFGLTAKKVRIADAVEINRLYLRPQWNSWEEVYRDWNSKDEMMTVPLDVRARGVKPAFSMPESAASDKSVLPDISFPLADMQTIVQLDFRRSDWALIKLRFTGDVFLQGQDKKNPDGAAKKL